MSRHLAAAALVCILLHSGRSDAWADTAGATEAVSATVTPGRSFPPELAPEFGKGWPCGDGSPSSTAQGSIAQKATGAVFHVSTEGRDDWSGRLAKPNDAGSDGPFASIEAARDAVRTAAVPGRIVVAGGDYYLTQPVLFNAEDRGLAIVAACGERPVLHGGTLVEGWTKTDQGRWTAALPPSIRDSNVTALFVDGDARPLARYPDAPTAGDPRKGWLFAAKPTADQWQGNTEFRYHREDLPKIEEPKRVVAHILGGFSPGSQWGSDTLPVTAIDTTTDTVHTEGTGYFFTAEGSRYFLAGAQEFLTAPGEWWQDRDAGRIDYIADDPTFPRAKVIAGVLPTFFRLQGADQMLIAGLELRDGAPLGSGKLGTDTRGFGAIRLEQANGVAVVDNVIENVGVGIHVSESADVLIAGNEISHIAGTGIYIGTEYGRFGKSIGARVLSNHIHDIGTVYFESAGIFFQAADTIRIADNLIEDLSQFGIAGGSIWGSDDSVHDAVIEDNAVHRANQQTADGGAIKLMGMQADSLDSIIRRNLVTDTDQLMNRADGTFWPARYESTSEWPTPISWAIYLDGKASGVLIEDNTLSRNVSAIGINGGWSNVVRGNRISDGFGSAFRIDDGSGRDWRPDWAEPNRIEDNSVTLTAEDGLAASVYAPGHGASYVHFVRNHYFGPLDSHSFQYQPNVMASGQFGSLADLQSAGLDEGSSIMPADPASPEVLP
ncbi:Nitrous oxidase accessory protein NosD, contains tandem CASH domains [Kaistia soli DSM 19436]|uniref:Nitrous oxidase accessory protein NosD, contains tandem CASH domains n=1 Tax=Kaistia soli DSM 19436 TaxID=1122133 RepID=A0A1M4Y2L6_9HYPH|nr:right-handed parallel beta-helix repeat-containing protein [Kaistia soli]SHF00074.1 Nitrous oxidase accessory protein NosD, contains tandem CASH domains [Kaistia soli DSM 19436]